jgi:hypothetical protein
MCGDKFKHECSSQLSDLILFPGLWAPRRFGARKSRVSERFVPNMGFRAPGQPAESSSCGFFNTR